MRNAPASKVQTHLSSTYLSSSPFHGPSPPYYIHRIIKPSEFCLGDTDTISCCNRNVLMERWNEHSDPRAAPNRSWKNATHMVGWDERFYSFHTWPLDVKPLPVAMASAGFYHSNKNTDEVICFGCGLVIKDWKKHDDPIQRHVERSSVLRPCSWMKEVTIQPAQYAPRTPPPTPPLSAPASKPHKCQACQKTFTSSNSFYKHRRRAHRNIRGRIGIPLKRPVVVFLGKHRVSKPTKQGMKRGRRGNTDLWSSD